MKSIDYPIKTTERGFKYVTNGIMVSDETKMCLTCKKPTNFIEVCSEQYFCSDECINKFYEIVCAYERGNIDA